MNRKSLVIGLTAACLISAAADAQEMPPPRRSPRTPVTRETVVERRESIPASRQVEGVATISDGEKLRINNLDLRLFGVVPPQLAASFGPQARAALDNLVGSQAVNCHIRDRDRDGRLLATCHAASGGDLALELLKKGLAVTARGSLANTELSIPYLAAEQIAQSQKLGLWSVAVPQPSKEMPAPPPPKEAPKDKEDKTVPPPPTPVEAQEQVSKITAELNAQGDDVYDASETAAQPMNFVERYQMLLSSALLAAAALGTLWGQKRQKNRERFAEIQTVAAALRGELMAARGIYLGRAKSIETEEDDRAAVWPRIRTALYTAYVGRLGLLGAEMARQISALYGQTSDYTALYGAAGGQSTPKKQALETMIRRIDEVLPKLAAIEYGSAASHAPAVTYAQNRVIVPEPQPQATVYAAPAAAYGETSSPLATLTQAPAAVWDAVRTFMQSRKQEAPQPQPMETEINEYAAMIEADMARYQYGEAPEATELPAAKSPRKKGAA